MNPARFCLILLLSHISASLAGNTPFWSGRVDLECPTSQSQRWHQQVRPLDLEASCLFPEAETGVALIGFSSDEGVRRNQGRPGARTGPDTLRKVLSNLPWNRTQPLWDTGNIVCDGQLLESAQNQYAQRTTKLLKHGLFPVGLGGGHEIAWGSYLGLAHYLEHDASHEEVPPKIGIINIDAHFDLREPSPTANSGTPFYQMAEYSKDKGWPFYYFCLGISRSSNSRLLFERAEQLDVDYVTDRQMSQSDQAMITTRLYGFLSKVDHVYLTIDLDAFSAALAPGVSAPAVMGISLGTVETLLGIIKGSGKLKLFDIAEYNPEYDIDNRTARLAARLIYQLVGEQ